MPTASETLSGASANPASGLEAALARAVVWRRLALGFFPPGAELERSLNDPTQRRGLRAALARLALPRFEPGDTTDLDVRFADLFGHTVQARVCPYETEYGTGRVFRQTHELADLRGWYAAFGLARRAGVAERADHLGVECDFAGFLCQKEAVTLESGDGEELDVVRAAYRRFLGEHLARFGIAVTVAIEGADPAGFYGGLAKLCRGLLTAECRRLGIEPGPRAMAVRPEGDGDVPAACGAGAEGALGEPDGASPLGRSAPTRLVSIGDRR